MLALRDITETPHATDFFASNQLGAGVTLEDTPVLKQQGIKTFHIQLAIKLINSRHKDIWVGQLVEHKCQHPFIIPRPHNVVWYVPHLGEASIEINNLTLP